VIVTAASERNVAPQSQPSATFTESSQYGVGNTINGSSTDKGWSNWRSGTKNEQDTLSYALKQRETLTHVAVQFYRDGNTMSWPATLRVDRRVSGGDWIQGDLVTVPTPSSGAPKVDVPVAGAADEVRVVMNARSQTHMIVSEVEIFAAAPAPAGVADLARLTVGDQPVEGFAPDVLDYTVSSTGAAWPTLHALAVDEDASVVITQPGASESADTARVAALAATGGVGTVQVTAPDGTSRTYSVTVNRTVGVTSVTVTGEPRVGSTLRATVVTDPAEAAAAYSWMRDGVAIDGATADSYALTAADEGRQITVEATATAAGFAAGTARSAAVVPTAAVSDPGTGGGTDGGSGTPGAGTGSTGPGAGAGNGSPASSANTGAGSAANGRDLATTGQNTEGVLVLSIGALVLLLLGAGAVVLRRRRSRV